eukprot:Amastigsp_a342470_10.p3 type:complete len:162 gc:universal Amastigsp_a342470_10:732-247(-)
MRTGAPLHHSKELGRSVPAGESRAPVRNELVATDNARAGRVNGAEEQRRDLGTQVEVVHDRNPLRVVHLEPARADIAKVRRKLVENLFAFWKRAIREIKFGDVGSLDGRHHRVDRHGLSQRAREPTPLRARRLKRRVCRATSRTARRGTHALVLLWMGRRR